MTMPPMPRKSIESEKAPAVAARDHPNSSRRGVKMIPKELKTPMVIIMMMNPTITTE